MPFIVASGSFGRFFELVERLEIDAHAEIDVDLAHGIAEIGESEVGIAAGVDCHDEAAAPPHHLVDPEILEMAAVGEIDPGLGVGGQPKGFLDQRLDGRARPLVGVGLSPSLPGLPSHQPSRTLNSASNSVIDGEEL